MKRPYPPITNYSRVPQNLRWGTLVQIVVRVFKNKFIPLRSHRNTPFQVKNSFFSVEGPSPLPKPVPPCTPLVAAKPSGSAPASPRFPIRFTPVLGLCIRAGFVVVFRLFGRTGPAQVLRPPHSEKQFCRFFWTSFLHYIVNRYTGIEEQR